MFKTVDYIGNSSRLAYLRMFFIMFSSWIDLLLARNMYDSYLHSSTSHYVA